MKTIWDTNKIQEVLPHRFPFIFIDRVVEVDVDEGSIRCIKNVTINDYFFQGHFPGNPVMPGVISVEAMAQASILLFAFLKPEIAEKKPVYYLGKVEVRFLSAISAGDQMLIDIAKEKLLDKGGIVTASIRVKDKIAVKARIGFGVALPESAEQSA